MAGYIGNHSSVVTSGVENKTTFNITESTSDLTGLAYTPHRVHVFHNGVRLVDVTDYTATNSTSIVLTTAAVSGDQIVVISYAAFAVNDTVSASTGGTFSGPISVTGNTSVTGNIAVTGTVDGRDVAADGALAASALQPNGDGSNLTGISTEPHKYQYIGSITYAVTVASYLGANRYYLDGVVYPVLALRRGNVYTFDLSNSSNSGHPLRFKNADDSSYSVGVVVTGTPGQSGAKVTLTVAANAPNALKYYCTVHGNGMGNTIGVTAGGVLNVGTFNYFNQKALTSDTTVSFASVPTNAKWQYSCVTPNLDAGNVTASVYTKGISVTDKASGPEEVFFKPDGTKMYIADDADDKVFEYNLIIAWDVTSAVFSTASPNFSAEETTVRGLFFKPDGLTMYISGNYLSGRVHQYTLSTAWDVSSATYTSRFTTGSEGSRPEGLFFKPDGTKMYLMGSSSDDVLEYNLSTAWNVTTAVYSQAFSTTGVEGGPHNVSLNTTGTKMYILGDSGKAVLEYTLSTAWNVTTATYVHSFSVGGQENDPTGMFIRADGCRMFVIGSANDTVFQYEIGAATAVTLPAAVVGTPSPTAHNDKVTYTFLTDDGGTTVDLIAEDIV